MTNTNQPLALRYNAPAAFGSNEEINAIVERMEVLFPNVTLSDWQLKPENRAEAERDLRNAYFKAAQIAVFYQLVPGIDIHIMTRGGKFIVDIGLESWRKAADRQCAMMRISYHIHTELMTPEEVKARRGANYMPGDVGATATLWRSDKEGAYARFGEDSMTKASGAWVEKASWNKYTKEWTPDTIPNQRTKQDVAERRAIRAVLKKEFSLDSLLAATPAEIQQNLRYLEKDIRHKEEYRAVPDTRRTEVDENGFIVIEPTPRPTVHDVEFVVADEDDMPEPDVDEIVIEQPQGDATDKGVDYSALVKKLSGTAASFASWTKSKHLASNGPASVEQYRFLVGLLNGITGDKQSYRDLLGVMTGRYVNSEDRPGVAMVAKLLEWLRVDYVDEVTGEKIANPQYRADYAAAIKDMWQTIKGDA